MDWERMDKEITPWLSDEQYSKAKFQTTANIRELLNAWIGEVHYGYKDTLHPTAESVFRL